MKEKSRNPIFAKTINKLFRIYWLIMRPKTKGVKALITNSGKILMVRLTYYPNTWTFPGGGVNKNEDPRSAVMRECKEEVGIKLSNPKFLQSLNFNHEYKKDTVYIYQEEVTDNRFKIDLKEIAEAQWFDLKNLPPNIGKNALQIIEIFK